MTNLREIRCDVRSVELLRQLVELPLPLNLGNPRAEHTFLRDTYLDTPDGRLRQYGMTCRYRVRGDDRRRLTLFLPATEATTRSRERCDADLDEVDVMKAVKGESTPARRLRAIVDPDALTVAYGVHTERFMRRSTRWWLSLALFDFAYDIVSVEQKGVVRRFQELRVRRRRGGPPSLARIAAALQDKHGLRPVLVSRLERERLTATGVSHEAERRAVESGHTVVLIVLEHGAIACYDVNGQLRLPSASGSGVGACRHLLREHFGSSVGDLRLLGDLPADDGRPHLEVWLALQTRLGRQPAGVSAPTWLSIEELTARAGTRALSDPTTLTALLVAARSDLAAIARSAKAVPVRSSTPTPVPADSEEEALDEKDRLLDPDRSLLEFNSRVLALAENESTPLLERLQFLAIVSSNVDEFFTVRMPALKRPRVDSTGEQRGERSEQRLSALSAGVRSLAARQQAALRSCLRALELHGVHVVPWTDLDVEEKAKLHRYFRDVVFPALTPQAVTEAPGYPRPRVESSALSLALMVKDPRTGPVHLAYLRIPTLLPRLIPVRDGRSFVRLEELISDQVDTLYRGREVLQAFLFRVTRSGDLDVVEEAAGDLLQAIEEDSARRATNAVVRVEVESAMPDTLRKVLLRELRFDGGEELVPLGEDEMYEVDGPLDLTMLRELASLPIPELRYPAPQPRLAFPLERSIFEVVKERDRLVHHPYDDFGTSVQRLIEEAADDPAVTTIKITLYRTGERSPIVDALLRAARAGKDVAVFVELKARFDEERNVRWARKLADAGIHVVHGLVGLKTHAKIALVVRREEDTLRRYVHIGTGNYNASTARQYTDLGLFSADPALTADVNQLFNELTGSSKGPLGSYQRLLVAPHALLPRVIERINREAEHAREGRPSGIRVKVNGLSDVEVIEALYRASQAGVHIELIVRGICRLRPGVPDLSENIRVVSRVGRFLEHARIYRFENGGDTEYFIGSADWRPRNLRRRIEVVASVTDAACRAQLDAVLNQELADPTLWRLQANGRYTVATPARATESASNNGFAASAAARADMAPA